MARVRMPDKCELASWDDVNLTLAEIGELERKLTDIETKMNADIDAAKLASDVAADPHKKRIEYLKEQMKKFADTHVADLGKKKTKFLVFGKLGFRKSSSLTLPKDKKELAEMVRKLKAQGMSNCLVPPPEKIDKNKLKKYPPAKITAVGAIFEDGDTFWYEVDKEELLEDAASDR